MRSRPGVPPDLFRSLEVLSRDPDNPEALDELGILVRRRPDLELDLDFLSAEDLGRWLLREPQCLGIQELFLRRLGLRSPEEGGLPREVTREKDQAPMCRVQEPGGGLAWLYVDRYEVTVARYRLFLESTGHPPPRAWDPEEELSQLRRPERPVIYVSFQDAEAYCDWVGGSLPTPEDWAQLGRGALYPWGEAPPKVGQAHLNPTPGGALPGWWEGLAEVEGRPAGQSLDGIEDLIGNVFEWARDPDPRSEQAWLMGCSWTYGPEKVRGLTPGSPRSITRIPNGSHEIGFRVVVRGPPAG